MSDTNNQEEEAMSKTITVDGVEYVEKGHTQPVLVPSDDAAPLAHLVGQAVFIRTVTNYFTGRVIGADKTFVTITEAAQVFHTGRLTQFLADGKATNYEVEVWPADVPVSVAVGGIIDVSLWGHELPRVQV